MALTDASRAVEWDAWYVEHLNIMLTVPGVSSAQRFVTDTSGYSPSLAFQNEEVRPLVAGHIVGVNDVGVIERGSAAGFAIEPFPTLAASSACFAGSTFSAMPRRSAACSAKYTWPIPPAPI